MLAEYFERYTDMICKKICKYGEGNKECDCGKSGNCKLQEYEYELMREVIIDVICGK